MYLRVKAAKYVPRYRVDIKFNDGTQRIVDFGAFLKQARNPMFTKYRRPKEFKSFHIHDGDLMWGDYEMIFPIADLHHGDILHSEEAGATHYILSETAVSAGTVSMRKAEPVFYKKSSKRQKNSPKRGEI